MALLCLTTATLRIISEITSFLLNDPCHPSLRECLLIHVPTSVADGSPQSMTAQVMSYFMNLFDISLPRELTVFGELPLSTSYLLRLTEVVSPDFVLFLVVLGLTSLLCIPCVISLIMLCCCMKHALRLTILNSDQIRDSVHSTPTSENLHLTAPVSTPALSDLAQTIAPTVAANNCEATSLTRRTRRR